MCNPTDIGSRGVTGTILKGSRLWWEGPHWLLMGMKHWPNKLCLSDSQEIQQDKKKLAKVMAVRAEPVQGISNIMDANQYNSMSKLLNVTSYVLPFARNLKCDRKKRNYDKLSIAEICEAEKMWIMDVQGKLKVSGNFKELSSQLGVVDESGILLCKGRLGNSDLEIGAKYPVLLPRDNKFTELIIEECHKRIGHLGLKTTLAEVCSKYWIPKSRQYVKRLLTKCRMCIRAQGKNYGNPPDASLPEFRVENVPPFTNVGVDLFSLKKSPVK